MGRGLKKMEITELCKKYKRIRPNRYTSDFLVIRNPIYQLIRILRKNFPDYKYCNGYGSVYIKFKKGSKEYNLIDRDISLIINIPTKDLKDQSYLNFFYSKNHLHIYCMKGLLQTVIKKNIKIKLLGHATHIAEAPGYYLGEITK